MRELEAKVAQIAGYTYPLSPIQNKMVKLYTNHLEALIESKIEAIGDDKELDGRIAELESLFVDFDDRKLRHRNGTKLTTIGERLTELKEQRARAKSLGVE